MADFPSPGVELTHILVVEDVARSSDWYEAVLGASLHRSYGGTLPYSAFRASGYCW